MASFKSFLSAICRPFAKRRKLPRLVFEVSTPSPHHTSIRLSAENTSTGLEYELKTLAACLFMLSKGFNDENSKHEQPSLTASHFAHDAYTLACILVAEANGSIPVSGK